MKITREQATERLIKVEEETQLFWSAHDDLEQYTMKTSLEIVGVPEGCFTSTEEVVLGLVFWSEMPSQRSQMPSFWGLKCPHV